MDVVSVNYIGKSGCLFLIFVTCGFVISRGFFSKQEPTAIPLAAQIPSNPNQTTVSDCAGENLMRQKQPSRRVIINSSATSFTVA